MSLMSWPIPLPRSESEHGPACDVQRTCEAYFFALHTLEKKEDSEQRENLHKGKRGRIKRGERDRRKRKKNQKKRERRRTKAQEIHTSLQNFLYAMTSRKIGRISTFYTQWLLANSTRTFYTQWLPLWIHYDLWTDWLLTDTITDWLPLHTKFMRFSHSAFYTQWLPRSNNSRTFYTKFSEWMTELSIHNSFSKNFWMTGFLYRIPWMMSPLSIRNSLNETKSLYFLYATTSITCFLIRYAIPSGMHLDVSTFYTQWLPSLAFSLFSIDSSFYVAWNQPIWLLSHLRLHDHDWRRSIRV